MEDFIQFVNSCSGPEIYFIIFGALVAGGFGLPISEEIVMVAAGMLIYWDTGNPVLIVVSGYLGVVIGDSVNYTFGRLLGIRLTRTRLFRRKLPPEKLARMSEKVRSKGLRILFATRFMPGLRLPTFLSAGVLKIPYSQFVFVDGLAALISVPGLIYLVYFNGERLEAILRSIKNVQTGILILIGIIATYLLVKWVLVRFVNKHS